MGKLCSWELFIQEMLYSMIKCFSNEFVVCVFRDSMHASRMD